MKLKTLGMLLGAIMLAAMCGFGCGDSSDGDGSGSGGPSVKYTLGEACDYHDFYLYYCTSPTSYYTCEYDSDSPNYNTIQISEEDEGDLCVQIDCAPDDELCKKRANKYDNGVYSHNLSYRKADQHDDFKAPRASINGVCGKVGDISTSCYGTGPGDTYLSKYECLKDVNSKKLYWIEVDSVSCIPSCFADSCAFDEDDE